MCQLKRADRPAGHCGCWELLVGSGDVSTLMLGVLLRSMKWEALARTPRARRGGPRGRA
jgi:hypothetical protein